MTRIIYKIDGGHVVVATPVTLESIGARERQDLQEWIISHPESLGDGILVVTCEYDKWESGSGGTTKKRLDILGLDTSGRLVVVELKRDEDSDIHLQAITYAAMVAGFTEETLADVYADFLTKRNGEKTSSSDALDVLRKHVEGELDTDILAVPRIILLARHHPQQVLTSTVWLTQQGLDIELRQVEAFQVDGVSLVSFAQMYPVPGVEDLLLGPARRRVDESISRSSEKIRSEKVVKVIIEKGLLEDGEKLTFMADKVSSDIREEVEKWLEEEPARGTATWVNEKSAPLRWSADGTFHSPTGLVKHILQQAANVAKSPRGPSWWVTEDGTDLVELVDEQGTTSRDWSDVHQVISLIRQGEWTSYGDLGATIGVHPRPLGRHIANCGECPEGGHRILTVEGKASKRFRWDDPSDMRTAQEALSEEGIRFTSDGKADPDAKINVEELRQRLKQM